MDKYKYALKGITHPGTFELEQGFNTIGRNPTNDFRLHDATVSSFHCEIVVSAGSILVHDLGSTNGTFVNDQRIDEAPLTEGQVLKLGSVELKLEVRSMPESAVVAIPPAVAAPPPAASVLPDGLPACTQHPDTHAAYRCTSCQKPHCAECVHFLQLSGGKQRVFCPNCSGVCQVLSVPPGVDVTPKREQSFLGRLTQTIRLRFK